MKEEQGQEKEMEKKKLSQSLALPEITFDDEASQNNFGEEGRSESWHGERVRDSLRERETWGGERMRVSGFEAEGSEFISPFGTAPKKTKKEKSWRSSWKKEKSQSKKKMF